MLKKSLKGKLVVGALAMVISVSLAITIVVSFLVNRQNLGAANLKLVNAMAIVKDDLNLRQETLAQEIKQMIIENKIGGTVKFLYEFATDELSISHNTYTKIAEMMLNQANRDNLEFLGTYDIGGTLRAFVVREDAETYLFGFYKAPQLHFAVAQKGREISGEEWETSSDSKNFKVPVRFGAKIPSTESTQFETLKSDLAIRATLPIFANTFNDDTGDPELKLVGAAVAVKKIDPAMVTKINRLTQMSVNAFAGNLRSMGTAANYDTIDTQTFLTTPDAEWNLATQMLTIDEIELASERYFQAVLPLFNTDGYVGAIALLQSDAMIKTNNSQILLMLSLVSLICIVLCIPSALIFAGTIVKPISNIVARLQDIAQGEGDLTKKLEILSADELGLLADSFNQFVDNIRSMIGRIKQNSKKLHDASSTLADISEVMSAGAKQASEKAKDVAHSGEEMNANMSSVAAAMEQATTNVQMVASATEEMSASISEITQNTEKGREIAERAVNQAGSASKQVELLGDSAKEIEKVIQTITEISEQVNLLALNATIEAARAGEAGKGFAVVANEIKELAQQTAAATGEIKTRVQGIQHSTAGTVDEIESISQVVDQLNEIVIVAAGAVSEQSATTGQIADNVSQVSSGIGEISQKVSQSSTITADISKDIGAINTSGVEMYENSAQINTSSKELAGLSQELNQLVGQFKI